MKKIFIFAVFFNICNLFAVNALDLVDSSEVNFVLANKKQGKEFLTTEDPYIKNLSNFDMYARMKINSTVSTQQFLDFIGQQTLDWTTAEKKSMEKVFANIKDFFRPYKIDLPKDIYFVKTTGREEGNSAYCRNQNVIVISQPLLKTDTKGLTDLFTHELFHIYSKNNLDVREKLYNQIGFYKTGELDYPRALYRYKITNPDSVNNNYYFKGTVNGETVNLMPLLLSSTFVYNEETKKEFFEYMTLVFWHVDIGEEKTELVYETASLKDISNFYDMVGKNTSYIIHPEEILADNFVLMINETKNLPSPEVVSNMMDILKK